MQDEEILKKVRNVTIVVAAIYLALGIVIFLFEGQVRALFGYILGAMTLGIGVYRMIYFFLRQRNSELIASDLYLGVALCSVGAVCMLRHGDVIVYSSFIFGILLVAGAIIKMQNAIDLHHIDFPKWWLVLVFAGISLVMALILMLNSTLFGENFLRTSAVFLLYDGGTGIAVFILFYVRWHEIKLAEKAAPLDSPAPAPEPAPAPTAGDPEPEDEGASDEADSSDE